MLRCVANQHPGPCNALISIHQWLPPSLQQHSHLDLAIGTSSVFSKKSSILIMKLPICLSLLLPLSYSWCSSTSLSLAAPGALPIFLIPWLPSGDTSSLSTLVFRVHRSNNTLTNPHTAPPGLSATPALPDTSKMIHPTIYTPCSYSAAKLCWRKWHTCVNWHHDKFISQALPDPQFFSLFFFSSHLFPVSSLLYFPLFSSSPNLSQLSPSFSANDRLLTAFGISFLLLSFKDSEIHAS